MLIDDIMETQTNKHQDGPAASDIGIGNTSWSTFFWISDAV
jgi:hypothetical protein